MSVSSSEKTSSGSLIGTGWLGCAGAAGAFSRKSAALTNVANELSVDTNVDAAG